MKSKKPRKDGRGGRREGAGRPRKPRLTLELSPDLLAILTEQAAQRGQAVEEYAADLLTRAGEGMPESSTKSSSVAPPAPRQLRPGSEPPKMPHHEVRKRKG